MDKLNGNAGGVLTLAERDQLAARLEPDPGDAAARAAALRGVAESAALRRNEFRRAFVLMQYFGYLRRDPDQEGFNFWLSKLEQFGGNYINAEMVKAFISSDEYKRRFGS